MRCAKCGKRLKKNEIFCTVCGYYNSELDEENIDEEFPEDDESKEEVELKPDLKEETQEKNDDVFEDLGLKNDELTKKIKSEVVDENEKLEKFIKLYENDEKIPKKSIHQICHLI